MRKLALATGMALGLAVASAPASAGEFIVENNLSSTADFAATLYVGCGAQYVVYQGNSSIPLDCPWGIHIRIHLGGDASIHSHDCSSPANPIHRIQVGFAGSVPATPDGPDDLAYSHSCEGAS